MPWVRTPPAAHSHHKVLDMITGTCLVRYEPIPSIKALSGTLPQQ